MLWRAPLPSATKNTKQVIVRQTVAEFYSTKALYLVFWPVRTRTLGMKHQNLQQHVFK